MSCRGRILPNFTVIRALTISSLGRERWLHFSLSIYQHGASCSFHTVWLHLCVGSQLYLFSTEINEIIVNFGFHFFATVHTTRSYVTCQPRDNAIKSKCHEQNLEYTVEFTFMHSNTGSQWKFLREELPPQISIRIYILRMLRNRTIITIITPFLAVLTKRIQVESMKV